MGADRADGRDQGAEPLAHRLARTDPARRAIGNGKEQGHRKDGKPQRDHRPHDADMLGRFLVEPKDRPVGLDEEDQGKREAGQPAHVTQPPAPPRDPPDARGARDLRQHRVVEDRRHLVADIGQDEEAERPQDEAGLRGGEPQKRGRCDGEHREGAQPRLASAGLIGDRPEDRPGDGGQQRRQRQRLAPERRPRGDVRRNGPCEIGREDERDDDCRKA